MRTTNWFLRVFFPPLINLYANRKSSVVDKQKDKNPNVDTAVRPRLRTSGSGVRVAELEIGLAIELC